MSVTIARTRRTTRTPDRSIVGLSIWTAVLAAAFLALLISDQVQAAVF
jgi:hypothetical protein